MKRLLAIVLIVAVVPFASVSASSGKATFNEKFTFNPVTYSDGTTGVIEAGSKQTGGGSTFTICDYYTDSWRVFLGYYQSSTFASDDPAVVEQFCLDHFVDRVQ